MSVRTDLAFESAQEAIKSSLKGVSQHQRTYENASIKVTETSVEDKSASAIIGKPVGKYVTIENTKGCFSLYSDLFNEQIDVFCKELSSLMDKFPKRIMFAGLGNRAITPDSLGPLTAEKVFATRHIKRLAKDIDTSALSDVSVITTGVMAQTGMESSETVKALADIIAPDVIIIVDALACSDLAHLGTTIQLTNTGISPGSGVENARKELSERVLGIPCIAIGVPTVADMNTVAEGLCHTNAPKEFDGMLVTPKSIDNLVFRSAGLISTAINRTFHPDLTDEEINSLLL